MYRVWAKYLRSVGNETDEHWTIAGPDTPDLPAALAIWRTALRSGAVDAEITELVPLRIEDGRQSVQFTTNAEGIVSGAPVGQVRTTSDFNIRTTAPWTPPTEPQAGPIAPPTGRTYPVFDTETGEQRF